ncbi:MAG: hypothetical protein WCI27_04075 [Candidatus Omnitrophota bacterium]
MRVGVKGVIGIVAGIIIFAVGSVFIYLTLNARSIFNAQASALTNRRVEARAVGVEFPAGIVIDGLSVEGLLECKRVHAAVDIFSLMSPAIRIRVVELDEPLITLDQTAPAVLASIPAVSSSKNVVSPASSPAGAVKPVILTHFAVRKGSFKLLLRGKSGGRREYLVDQIEVEAKNVPLTGSVSVRTEFSLTAVLPRMKLPFAGQALSSKGWLNWAARDMDAVAQVGDKTGGAGVEITLVSQRNDMKVSGTFNLSAKKDDPAQGKKKQRLEDVVLGLLASTGTDIKAGFSFKTKMDDVDFAAAGL